MLDIFIAELRRYRAAALLFAGSGLAFAYVVFRTSLFLEAPYYGQAQCLFLFTLSGILLAVFQFGSYRKPARWLWLLHRPIPRVQTFMALHLAAVALILLAAGIPLTLALLAAKVEQMRVVDTRHFLSVVHVCLFAILGWQTASYTMLARHRGASVVLVLPVMLATLYFASAYVLLIPALLCVGLMACALYTVFRPERHSSAKRQPLSVALAAVPIVLCTYYIMVWGTLIPFGFIHAAVGMNKPHNLIPGGVIEGMRTSGNGLIKAELARSTDARAPAWSQQIPPHSEHHHERVYSPNMMHHPVRHAATNAGYSEFLTGKLIWTFSHDRMQFIARDYHLDMVANGVLGPGGAGDPTPFPLPAVSIDPTKTDSFVYTQQALMLIDHKTMVALPLVTFTGDEVIASLPEVTVDDGSIRIITNRRFVEYVWPVANGQLQERYSIPLPGMLSDLGRVAIAKVADGTLVTLLFGQQQEYGLIASPVATYFVQDGKVSTILQRTLSLDVGFLYTQHFYWMSPALSALFQIPKQLIDTGKVRDAAFAMDTLEWTKQRPLPAHALALALMLASAAVAWLRLRRENSSPLYRAMWMLACLIIGLPALIALVALQAKQSSKQKASAAAAMQPA